jgi:hypothetical protein
VAGHLFIRIFGIGPAWLHKVKLNALRSCSCCSASMVASDQESVLLEMCCCGVMLGLIYVPALVYSVPSFVRLCSVPYASLPPALLPKEPRSVQQRAVRCNSTSVLLCRGSTVSFGVDATLARGVAYRKRDDCFSTFIVE